MIEGSASIVRLLAQQANASPDRTFARFDDGTVSFAALDRTSDSIANALRVRHIGAGTRIAVMLRNSPVALAVIFALAKSGIAWVPVNVRLRGDNLRYILANSDPCLVVADDDLITVIGESATTTPPVVGKQEVAAWSRSGEMFTNTLPRGGDLFAIMYTSGTTGPPKGVMVTHRMLRLAGEAVARLSLARDGDIFLVWEPLYHIGGAQLLAVALLHRIVLSFVERFSASHFWSDARERNATQIHFLGGILEILLKQPAQPDERRHDVRVAWGGGCPAGVAQRFQQRFGVAIRECYGMTETSSIATYNELGGDGAVGRALPWFEVSIRDRDGRVLPPDERGEIAVRALVPGALTQGYFRDAPATARALRDGVLYTGDLGILDSEGDLTFLGRLTDSVRCKGENVSAWEVEHVAAAHPAVEECAMIGVPSDIADNDIKLFVKLKSGREVGHHEISHWLSERLAPYQMPRYIVFVDEFQRTPSMRIMKHRLSREVHDCFDRLASTQGP